MASIISHAVVASGFGLIYAQRPMPRRFWVLTAVCAILPDADVAGFALGVPYGSMFGHRGISHSLPAAFVLGCVVARFAFPRWSWPLALYFFAVTASHGILDALTNGGLGVAFFAPLNDSRYFFPWRPVRVSPIGIRPFLSRRGAAVLRSEVLWLWLPSVLSLLGVAWYRRKSRRGPI